jgi:cysteine-rich repeat protein
VKWRIASLLAMTAATQIVTGCPPDVCIPGEFECIDEDGDGFCAVCCDMPSEPSSSCALLDCDDGDSSVRPGAADHFSDGFDFDCDGGDLGGEGAPCQLDSHCTQTCNVDTGLCSGEAESCGTGFDEDADGLLDCADGDCAEVCGGLISNACADAPLVGQDLEGQIADDFDGAPNLVATSCTAHERRERLYHLPTMPSAGELTIDLLTSDPQVLSLTQGCTSYTGASELACMSLGGSAAPSHEEVVSAGQDIWLVVEEGTTPAPFNLVWSLRPAVCGDGVIVKPEICDDGNVEGTDGCDTNCQAETNFDVCAAAVELTEGTTIGTTDLGTNLLAGSCAGEGALERLHRFVPETDGTLQVGLTSDAALAIYARSDCGDPASETSCSVADNGVSVLYVPVTAGEPVTIVVDGLLVAVGTEYALSAILTP